MQKGFFSSLFDLSFTSYITTKIIRVIYVLTLILIGLVAIGFVISAFSTNAAFGAATLLVLAPVVSLIYAIYARVILEFIIQVFRISEFMRDQNELQRAAFTAAGWLPDTAATPASSAATASSSESATASCARCGTPSSPGAAFCRACGNSLA